MSPHRLRLPISTRHAFALAFDLAVRRDAGVSLALTTLLRAPWILALAVLPPPSESSRPGTTALLTGAALLGDFLMLVLNGAMLRFRARSVFNCPLEMRPAPAGECYAQGLRRAPWLIVTEIARNLGILIATFCFVIPGIVLGYRLSFATEAVVLHDPTTEAAFRHSFRLTVGRFERWLEMIAVSVLLVMGIVVVTGTAAALVPGISVGTWVAVLLLLVNAVTPIIQYAWTFFYLRLVEVDVPAPAPYEAPGPLYAVVAEGVAREPLPAVESAPIALAPAEATPDAPAPPDAFPPVGEFREIPAPRV